MKLKDIINLNKSDIFIIDKYNMANINIILNNSIYQPIYQPAPISVTGSSFFSAGPSHICDVPHNMWEDEFMIVIDKIKYASMTPVPLCLSNLDETLTLHKHIFYSLEDVLNYINNSPGDPVLFSFRKILDISQLQNGYWFEIRIGFLRDKQEIREKIINELV